MANTINNKIFWRELSFAEWFEKNPDTVVEIPKIESFEFEAAHPGSRIYTIKPNDSLTKKCAKIALRLLFCVTIIPLICVKAVDFFKGEKPKPIPESDLNERLKELKRRIKIDQGRMLILTPTIRKNKFGRTTYHFHEDPHLLTSEEELDAFCKMILDLFKDDQKNALRFLGATNQVVLGFSLLMQLNNNPTLRRHLIPKTSDAMGDLLFTDPSALRGERRERDRIYVDFYKQKVVAKFELKAQFFPYPYSGESQSSLASGVAKVSLDFKKKRVRINWEAF